MAAILSEAKPAHRKLLMVADHFRIWVCTVCAFVYDEAEGIPSEGIPPGTRWEDVPDDWLCPECGARKTDFDMVEI